MAIELKRAHRDAHARTRCVFHLVCYVLFAVVLVAWVTGVRDWVVGEISNNPAWGALTLIAVVCALIAGAMQYRPPTDETIEARVRWRYAPADAESFQDIESLLEESSDVRGIVAGWLRIMPALRNAEIEQLRAAKVVWEAVCRPHAGAAPQQPRTRVAHGI